MQTLQQNQGKKPLVMYLLGSLNCGSLGSGFGNQYSKGIRQTPGGVWTDGTRGTTTLHPMPHTDFSVESTRGGGMRGGCAPVEEGMAGSRKSVQANLPPPPPPLRVKREIRETNSGVVLRESPEALQAEHLPTSRLWQ